MTDRDRITLISKKHINNTRKCIAFGVDFNDFRYFSFNGVKNLYSYGNISLLDAIKKILKNNAKFIYDKYAFSVFDPIKSPKSIDCLETLFYQNLYNRGLLFYSFLSYLTKRIDFITYSKRLLFSKEYINRFFTCAEKKLYNLPVNLVKVYITSRPCFHCLPVIDNVYYLEDENLINLRRYNFNNTDLFVIKT